MEIPIFEIVEGALAFIGAAVIVLKFIAPRTKTLADDHILSYLTRALEVIGELRNPKHVVTSTK